eukprot:s8070_g2.t1
MPRRSVDETVLGERMQGPDECGLFLLAAAAMGYGPAATGWPRWAASRWLHKVSAGMKVHEEMSASSEHEAR